MLELRAATDLARLWVDSGSKNNPRALLEPVIAMIAGGEPVRDVRAARALLMESQVQVEDQPILATVGA